MEGKAILYADEITGSMRRALDETERRREKQVEFNIEHGITPKSVQRRIADVMHQGYEDYAVARDLKAAEAEAEYLALSPQKLSRMIAKLEKEMRQAAQNLEFELAAAKRDEIRSLRETALRNAAA